jgi:DNA helicase-2/ATP-dependent DNA helicase PcrA
VILLQGSEILAELNKEQKRAVEHLDGPLLVLAGAGSGKTRVLTRRVAYLIKHHGIPARHILGVTFTNKAAAEMKERVASLLDGLSEEPWVSTFHSSCVRILAREIEKVGYKRNFVIFDQTDQKKLMKLVLKELNIDAKKTKPKAVLSEISRAKNELISPEDYGHEVGDFFTKIVNKIYPVYQQKLKDNNALDFDDLIMKTVELFRNNPLVLEYYQEYFKYILIDEYQDVNFAQYQLVQMLAENNNNLCVVGDPDQGIYGFRGADIRNILNFEDDYPETEVIKLEQNYRSNESILKAAQQVIKNNKFRKEKDLWTDRGLGNKLKHYVAGSEKDEGGYISRKIKKLKKDNYNYGDFAVLYRTNAQSRPLEEMMMKYGIPYQIIGGVKFYDRMEIKDILGYLRVLYNSDDNINLLRVINRPKRGIGAGTVGKIQDYANRMGLSLYEAGLEAEKNEKLTGVYEKRVKNFFSLMEDLRKEMKEITLTELGKKVLIESGYKKDLKEKGTEKAKERLENIKELFSVIKDYMQKSEDPTLGGFLEEVALLSDIDNMEDQDQMVTLMTLHSAKGLEFPVVFLAGLEEGIFPHINSMQENEDLEEERRLCYVGITRAEEKLYLLRAKRRRRFGDMEINPPSQFLKEIPSDLLEEEGNPFDSKGINIGLNTNSEQDSDQDQEDGMSSESGKSSKYKKGQKVVHPKWGKGDIIEVYREEGRTELKIDFGDNSVKTLMAKYAPIQLA